ncbi:receptor-type tyrosine-protein phosphatase alpha-like [Mercenaria mercenaria]|uniref:receptor-type tyrosine-protein phosphatase alpha-like n=1 Tax=Mercenaria mercenaria TaxID=6596 RepID=UPI00234F9FBA|nr:receptor-type tyrosine-protein phosphatase alpha-like [Mercenaria mercenaria]
MAEAVAAVPVAAASVVVAAVAVLLRFCCILAVWLFQVIFPENSLVFGDGNEIAECKINCACCKNQDCGPKGYFSEGNCYQGCLDGYHGARCYQKCTYNCTKCDQVVHECTSCYEGYYPGSKRDCTEKCPIGCKSCNSSKICTECKEDLYNANGSTDCPFSRCPLHCECEEGMCISCKAGYYDASSECTKTCPSNCVSCSSRDTCEVCKAGHYNGHESDNDNNVLLNNCTHECRTNCSSCSSFEECLQCESGKYGIICENECSVGCKNRVCLKKNGKCEACLKGKYGETCSLPCPYNCHNNTCYKETGYCFACNGNYDGNECNNCKAGFYGPSCNETCSSQCLNSTCDKATGQCHFGCKSNYSGDKCCVKSANCLNCSSNTECSSCKPGYFSEGCNKTCSPNCADSCGISEGFCASCKGDFHGLFCNLSCPISCKAPQNEHISRCEQQRGNCPYGCEDGVFGLKCNETCYSGCIENICMQDTGTCTKGCDKLAEDPECHLSSGQRSIEPPQSNVTGPVVGGVVGLIMLTAGVVVAIFFYKRRCIGKEEDSPGNAKKPESKNKEDHVYGNIPDNALSGKETQNKHSVNKSSPVIDIDDVEINEKSDGLATKPDGTYYNTEHNNHRVNVDNLLAYVTKEHVDSFENEFMKLNKGLDLTENCTVAKKPENIALNRYNGIYPYDHSRVTSPGQPDYFINACYIDGYNRRKAYIASLGPTAKTTDTFSTFWSMVWNEKSDIIVMLTNLRETSGMKCERYWPKVETETLYGQINVKCRSVEEYAEYTVRTFTISKGQEQRNLLQLHYTAWPDKGVPLEVTSLVEFRQRVKAVPVTFDGPIIVHCSAGVGRTGTYIALDQLTEEGKCEGSVDVFNCVNRMREQRVNMVQTAEQYTFLHKSLAHSLSFGCEALTAEQVQGIMYQTDDRMFTKLYQTLRQEVDIESKEEVDARKENRRRYKDKNRRQSDIPGGSSQVRLYLSRKYGQHDYINAVFINSFRIKNLFIAAQSPLPGTVEDFLSMIYQQNSTCVVALEEQHNQHYDVGKYLPADNETYTFGNCTVMSSKCETKPQYVLKKLSIRNEKGDEKTVSHFQYKSWGNSKKVPDSAETFVQFIKEVEGCIRRRTEDTPHIVVHCLNGYERSGLFCVVYKMLEKLEAERQVSVVNTVRKIRTHRKQSINSVEQLKFCYQCISAYMEIYNTYSNFAT